MIAQITFNKENDDTPENVKLLHKLGAVSGIDFWYIEIDSLYDIFSLNVKLTELTNKYWFVSVAKHDDENFIFLELDKGTNPKPKDAYLEITEHCPH